MLRDNAKANRGGNPYGWGRIVNIVSTAGLYGNYGQAAYASAKAGLVALTRVTALDMARSGITANAIAPFAATRVTGSIKPANDGQAQYKARAMKVPAKHVAAFAGFLHQRRRKFPASSSACAAARSSCSRSPRPVARISKADGDWTPEALAGALERELPPSSPSSRPTSKRSTPSRSFDQGEMRCPPPRR